jgi:hypothetical protein
MSKAKSVVKANSEVWGNFRGMADLSTHDRAGERHSYLCPTPLVIDNSHLVCI